MDTEDSNIMKSEVLLVIGEKNALNSLQEEVNPDSHQFRPAIRKKKFGW